MTLRTSKNKEQLLLEKELNIFQLEKETIEKEYDEDLYSHKGH